MSFISFMNERVKRLNIIDVKLAQGAAIFVGLVIVKLLPQIMEISIWWFIILAVLFGLRPVYVFYLKN